VTLAKSSLIVPVELTAQLHALGARRPNHLAIETAEARVTLQLFAATGLLGGMRLVKEASSQLLTLRLRSFKDVPVTTTPAMRGLGPTLMLGLLWRGKEAASELHALVPGKWKRLAAAAAPTLLHWRLPDTVSLCLLDGYKEMATDLEALRLRGREHLAMTTAPAVDLGQGVGLNLGAGNQWQRQQNRGQDISDLAEQSSHNLLLSEV
jgi:hypothetical protein